MLIRSVAFCLLLTGCLQAAQPSADDESGYTSAKALYEAASTEARENWSPNARLNVVESLESPVVANRSSGSEVHDVLSRKLDPAPGDGRAYRWLFAFVDDTRDVDANGGVTEYYVVIDGQGEILLSRVRQDNESTVAPFPWKEEWVLDSDEASQKAEAASKAWDPTTAPPKHCWLQLSVLPRGGDGPGVLAWRFMVGYDDGRGEIVNVNAQTGETWIESLPSERA